MRITLPELFKHFDRGSLERGQELYESGAVRSWAATPTGEGGLLVRGLVESQSRDGREYRAAASLEERGRLGAVSCSCPVGSHCKHGAALLLSFVERVQAGDPVGSGYRFERSRAEAADFEERPDALEIMGLRSRPRGEQSRGGGGGRAAGRGPREEPERDAAAKARALLARAGQVEARRLPFQEAELPGYSAMRGIVASIALARGEAAAAGTGGGRWQGDEAWALAFAVGPEPAAGDRSYGPPGAGSRLAFWRALRYLKKDGTPGRLAPWKPGARQVEVPEGSRAYLARFPSSETEWLPLGEVLDLLLAAPPGDLSFSIGRPDNSCAFLELLEFSRLRVEPAPRSFDPASGRFAFTLAFALSGLRALGAPGAGSAEPAGQGVAGQGAEGIVRAAGADELRTGPSGLLASLVRGRLCLLVPGEGKPVLALGSAADPVAAQLLPLFGMSQDLGHSELAALAKALSGAGCELLPEPPAPAAGAEADPKPRRGRPRSEAKAGPEPAALELAMVEPPREVELRKVAPRAVLRIGNDDEFDYRYLSARLLFEYEGERLEPEGFEEAPFAGRGFGLQAFQRLLEREARKKARGLSIEGSLAVARERDREAEARIRDLAESLLRPAFDPAFRRDRELHESGVFPLAVGRERIVLEIVPSLLDAGFTVVYEDEEYRSLARVKAGVRLASMGGWFEGRMVFRDGEEELEVEDPAELLERGLGRSRGRLLILSPEERSALAILAERMDPESGALRIKAEDFGRLEAAAELSDEAGKSLLAERVALGHALAAAFLRGGAAKPGAGAGPAGPAAVAAPGAAIPAEPLPSGLRAELRPYQKEGYDRLCLMYDRGLAALLADDMGLGKTLQSLALILRLKERGELGLGLVVAPLTLLGNWEAEAERFAPGLRVRRHHGPGRARDLGDYAGADLLVTTYQTLRADLALFEGRDFGLLAMDEAQAVKNPDSAAFSAVRAVKARRRLSITGTPVENRPLELWSQFDLILPGLLDERAHFERRYSKAIADGSEAGAAAAARLRRLVAPFVIRRRKEDVLAELPPKEEILRELEPGAKQAAVYERLRAELEGRVRRTLGEKGARRSAIAVFEALLRLRQAAIHPGLLAPEYEKAGSVKFDFLEESLEELVAEGHRVLVFSQFVEVLRRAERLLAGLGLGHEYLDGQTRDRAGALARFKGGTAPVFLLSLKAGGLGVNLPEADYVILLDPWWNPAVEAQAVDRAHRIGQSRPVTVLKPVVKGTVEEKILELQRRKKAMVEELVSDSGGFFSSLSEDEILGLFS